MTIMIESSSDQVDPNDPHISDFLNSHYDCSKRHNLRQFRLTPVQPCLLFKIFPHLKALALAWTCEANLNAKKLCVLNQIINIAVMIVLITIKTNGTPSYS